ncbi:MAG: hypothetical protein ACYS0I_10115 [Planctomycetota bacterium]
MPEHKRLSNKFEWLPPEKRPSRHLGPKPPRKPERKLYYFGTPAKQEKMYIWGLENFFPQ